MASNRGVTKLTHLILIRRFTLVQNDPGTAFFAVSFIRHANYLYITHLRIGQVDSSISRGYKFSPPRMIISFKRPVTLK